MASKAALAGNYAASGGSGDPEFVADRLTELQSEQREEAAERVEEAAHSREMQSVVESDDGDLGTLDFGEKSIPLLKPLSEELGIGHLANLQRPGRADEGMATESFLAALDALAACTPEEYGRNWWYDRTEEELGRALQQGRQQSAGGEKAGE